MSIQLENLRRDLRGRLETDKQMSGIWAIVPLLPIIIGVLSVIAIIAASIAVATAPSTTTTSTAVFAVFGFFALLELGYFIFAIFFALMVFFLVRRRNSHFNRQILLYEDLVSVSKEIASKKNVDVSFLINNMDRSLREARLEDLEKNATLWTLFGGLGWIYAGYFLLKDFYKHERREDLFVQDLLRTLYQLGIPINLPYRNPPIPDRSFALYFVLTLITGGIFGVYWVYVLVSDPNNHFRQQMSIEDTVMAQVSPLFSSAVSPPPPTPPQPPAPT